MSFPVIGEASFREGYPSRAPGTRRFSDFQKTLYGAAAEISVSVRMQRVGFEIFVLVFCRSHLVASVVLPPEFSAAEVSRLVTSTLVDHGQWRF